MVERRTSIIDAFRMADDVLRQGVQGITDLITVPGLINLDFADVRTIMQDAGASLMGIGTASANRASRGREGGDLLARCSNTTVAPAPPACCSTSRAAPTSASSRSTRRPGSSARPQHDDCNVIFGAVIDEGLRRPSCA